MQLGFVRFVSILAPRTQPYAIIDQHGKMIHVYDAEIIRALSRYLEAAYEILTPPDGEYGRELSEGNWTGMIGMVKRSEADLAMAGLDVTEERFNVVNYSDVYLQSRITFMTDKAVPLSKKFSIFYPFSCSVWILLLVTLITVGLLFYILINRKRDCLNVVLCTFGSLLHQAISFELNTPSIRILMLSWLLWILIITNSYKSVLLSFLSFPTMVGVRSISDLSKASSESSFKCFTYRGSYIAESFLESGDASLIAIGECLSRNDIASTGDTQEMFRRSPRKKAFIGTEHTVNKYRRSHFISGDSFYPELNGIPFAEKFCCPERLNLFVHRFAAGGIFEKIRKDDEFFYELQTPLSEPNQPELHKIFLDDVAGAFLILMAGWLSGFVAFFLECLTKKVFR